MFKNHLTLNRESIIIVMVGMGLLILFLVTVMVSFFTLRKVYTPIAVDQNNSPIDVETVNQAIEYLN